MKKLVPLLFALLLYAPQALAADSAVILMYHRFGESGFPSTNVRLEQLEAHIAELKSGPYTVLPVPEILSRIKKGDSLPDRTIGITIDDGFKSIYTEAWPRFKEAGLPFTVFISTGPIDGNRPGMMSWDEIRELRGAGVNFGAHTVSHLHMTDTSREKNEAEIVESNQRMLSELGERPTLFAYPYGEAGNDVIEAAKVGGYAYSFGQHSGVIHPESDFDYLPRFAMNENFGNLSRFKLVANTLPFRVTEFTPADSKVGDINPPNVGFTAAPDLKNLQRVTCFVSGEGRVPATLLGSHRIEVRASKPFAKGRTRLNCTLPGLNGRWHWLGTMFVRPRR